jgi:Domain of unknown function (DUF6894)
MRTAASASNAHQPSNDGDVAMPTRFYFHLVKGKQRVTDHVGVVLSRQLVASPHVIDKVRERWPGTDDAEYWETWSVEIADAAGDVVRTIALI